MCAPAGSRERQISGGVEADRMAVSAIARLETSEMG